MCYDTCSGTRSSGLMVDENPDDIVHALAVRYMQVDCSVRTPNKTRLDSLPGLMAEYYRVDGVVEVVLQACHTYNVEAVRVKCIVEAEGIPYLGLETDYWLTLAKLTPVWRHFWKFCKKNSKMRFPAMVYNCWACLSQLCGKNTNLTVWVRLYGL